MSHAVRAIERTKSQANTEMLQELGPMTQKCHRRFGEAGVNPYSLREAYRDNKAYEASLAQWFTIEIDRSKSTMTYTAKDTESLNKMAQAYANNCWNTYIQKMTAKFAQINADSVDVIGNDPLMSTLVVAAKNNVTFTVVTSVIVNCSQQGTLFNQFPARFGQVQQNGIAVKNAASVKKVAALTA